MAEWGRKSSHGGGHAVPLAPLPSARGRGGSSDYDRYGGFRSVPASPRALSPLSGRPSPRGGGGGGPTPRSQGGSRPLPSPGARPRTGPGGAAGSGSSGIKVVVRVRPLNETEAANGYTETALPEGPRSVKVVTPADDQADRIDNNKGRDARKEGKLKVHEFEFHACMAPHVIQADVWTACGIPQLVDASLRGYNVSVLAYGMTGSGKTFTMSGREADLARGGNALQDSGARPSDGIIPRALRHILSLAEQLRGRANRGEVLDISLSQVEIYNEMAYDLIEFTGKPLAVKWDAGAGYYVDKARKVQVTTVEQAEEIVAVGARHRRRGEHELNHETSRSHAIFTVHVAATSIEGGAGTRPVTRRSKLLFVDLAGSERLKQTGVTGAIRGGAMLKETGSINKSLFTLGTVISALGGSKQTGVHVPYRDSLLTKLLMDSIGGSALTLMVACVSPASGHTDQTLSTLAYAQKAKNIRNKPAVQIDAADAEVMALQKELALLRRENAFLRDENQFLLAGGASGGGAGGAGAPPGTGTGAGHSSREAAAVDEVALLQQLTALDDRQSSSEGAAGSGGAPLRRSAAGAKAAEDDRIATIQQAKLLTRALTSKTESQIFRTEKKDMVAQLRKATDLIDRMARQQEAEADERDRLRASRQLLALDHRGLEADNEHLRQKVSLLENLLRQRGGEAPASASGMSLGFAPGAGPDGMGTDVSPGSEDGGGEGKSGRWGSRRGPTSERAGEEAGSGRGGGAKADGSNKVRSGRSSRQGPRAVVLTTEDGADVGSERSGGGGGGLAGEDYLDRVRSRIGGGRLTSDGGPTTRSNAPPGPAELRAKARRSRQSSIPPTEARTVDVEGA